MKKMLAIFLLLILAISVYGQQEGNSPEKEDIVSEGNKDSNETEAGLGTQGEIELQTGNDDLANHSNQLMNRNRTEIPSEKREEIKQMIQQRKQEMDQEMGALGEKEQKVYQNQNQVRLAVHALLEMKDSIGGIGKNVSEIAKSFNNSVMSTIRAEERIQKKSGFARFFTGGDEQAAEEIENEVAQNQEKIKELKQIKEECDCDEETKGMMQEQIQNMEQEQTRLQELAAKEKKSKGIFGWIWK